MARLPGMSRHSHRLRRTRLMLATVAVAAVGLLAACSGTPERSAPGSAPASGGVAEGVGAPAPQNGPPPDLTLKRDVVKTASMTIDVASTSEAADKAAVVVERADGRV